MALPITAAQPQITQAEHQDISDLRSQAIGNFSTAFQSLIKMAEITMTAPATQKKITRAYTSIIHKIANPELYETPYTFADLTAFADPIRHIARHHILAATQRYDEIVSD